MSTYTFLDRLKNYIKSLLLRDPYFENRQQFKREDARQGLRLNYPLTRDSVVVDLGGYTGEWAEQIWNKYHCNIFIFEPVEDFLNQAKKRLKDNPKIHFLNFGLSDKDGEENISMAGPASSVFAGTASTKIHLKDARNIFSYLDASHIDLLKINIEGGEFKVLPRMIECGLITKCENIQVQFHRFYPDSERLRQQIQESLKKTHHLTYNYPFTFENWKKND